MKKRIILALIICCTIPFVIPEALQSRQIIGFTTHCWSSGKGSGDGGFYKCDETGCSWVDDDDPLTGTEQECDQLD